MRSLRRFAPADLSVVGWTAIIAIALAGPVYAQKAAIFRIGSPQDAVTSPKSGFALMGGGTDLDEAFRWLGERANGGDFVILRASGDDDYNPYVQKLSKLNSVTTLIIPSHEAASEPLVAEAIAHAEAVFIAGGDQAKYIRYWTGTPVQRELNAAMARGVPLGGTSAGLAVMGEWVYSAEGDKPDDPNLDAKTALTNPLGPRITLVHGFLDIPILKGIITDTHFAKRNRMGRLLVFLAKIQSTSPETKIRGIGIEERAAMLMEPSGQASVVGHGAAYLVMPLPPAPELISGKPFDKASFDVQKVDSGKAFEMKKWCCGETPYRLSVDDGKIRSHRDVDSIY